MALSDPEFYRYWGYPVPTTEEYLQDTNKDGSYVYTEADLNDNIYIAKNHIATLRRIFKKNYGDMPEANRNEYWYKAEAKHDEEITKEKLYIGQLKAELKSRGLKPSGTNTLYRGW